MTGEKRKLRRKRLILTLFYIIFVAMSVFGVSAMYLNSNYRKDVKWIYGDAYEDSAQFDKQSTEDIDRIFTYVGYKDMFETNGKLDMYEIIVKASNGPGEQGTERTLDRIMCRIKIRGYRLGENFQLARSPISIDDEEEEITVDLQSYNSDFADADAGEAPRMAMEDPTLGILVYLSEYYTICYNYIENDTNLSFRIECKSDKGDTKVSINVPDKTMEEIVGTRKYLYASGNTARMDTNMATVPTNAVTLLEMWDLYKNDKNYMALPVDANYSDTDAYSIEARTYKEARNEFVMGIGSVILGGLGYVVTLVMLILMSGCTTDGNTEIRLFLIDDTHTELCLILWTAAAAVLIHIERYVRIRLSSLFTPNEQWNYWNKMIRLIIVYRSAVLCGLDLLHRYKARTLWSNSLARRVLETSRDYVGRVSYAVGTGFCYLLFLGLNTGMLWELISLSFYKGNELSYQIIFYVFVVLCLGLDGWIYHLLSRKSMQRGVLDMVVSSISRGSTNYQIDTARLSGKERQMAEHLNNISSGLDLTIQEQVKNGQLKASLIINVSHDIKTPLIPIINYINLLKRGKIQNPKTVAYLEALDRKSRRLKILIEDLVEVSKASSDNMKLGISDIDLVELVQQTNGELEKRSALRRLGLTSNIPDEVLVIQADGRRLWRVLEDLYTNAVKYIMEHSRVHVDILDEGGKAIFTIKNVPESSLNISPDELTERFVRGDVSRTTEGNGLGLSISRDLTRLQGGESQIVIDGDLFKAVMSFPVKRIEFRAEKTVGEPGDISQGFGYEGGIVV